MRIEQKGSPLVYGTPKVLRAAEKLMPGRVLEVEVGRAIRAGRVVSSNRRGTIFLTEHQLVAHAARVPARTGRRGRRPWLVTQLSELRPSGRSRTGEGSTHRAPAPPR